MRWAAAKVVLREGSPIASKRVEHALEEGPRLYTHWDKTLANVSSSSSAPQLIVAMHVFEDNDHGRKLAGTPVLFVVPEDSR